ncbi:MAG: hypothetical protein EP301_04615, partial [Gammaproteobacteria bacterium]
MANSREHFALDWIKGELLETLNDARQALEAFVESDRDETRMRACLTGLHQVHGTLVMLELSGVTLLADHLEQLAQKMLSGDVEDEPGASQVLMQGILELPGHLEEIRAGGADSTRGVADLINEIRAHLNEAPLAFEDAVVSIARGASAESLDRFKEIDGTEKTRKIRAAYQQVLLSILKGESIAGSVPMLGKIAKSLQRVCQGTPHEQQWEAFGEFVTSLEGHDGPLEGERVKLLRRVDSEIRALGQHGVGSLKEPVSLELVTELLDAAEERQHENEVTSRLRDEIASAEDEGPVVSPSGRQALSSAAGALREELLLVKDQLDLIVRAGGDSIDQLGNLIAPLKQIGSTLSLLGFENSKSIVDEQVELLNGAQEGAPLEQSALMSIAGALVQVDENLASFSHGGKDEAEMIFDSAQKAVTVEARQGLDLVKQDVVDFIASEWDPRHLTDTAGRIASICGALDMIPLARASLLLSSCGDYVQTALAGGHTPSWQEMDLFADAISGIDYYLERIGEASSFGVEDVLDLVARALEGLEIPPAAAAPEAAADAPAEVTVADEATGAEEPAAEEFLLAESDALEEQAAPEESPVALGDGTPVDLPGDLEEEEEEPKLEMDDDSGFDLSGADFDEFGVSAQRDDAESEIADASEPQEPEQLPEAAAEELVAEDAEDTDEALRSLDDVLAEPEEAELDARAKSEFEDVPLEDAGKSAAPIASLPPGREPVVDPSLVDSFESDEEIVEIFVEEVDEVLENVDEWLPQWRVALESEREHEEALSEVRRAFHTLKGSGRIVGANVIGEVAWSVENMMNRLIDGTVSPGLQYVSVVEQARSLVPVLKDAFETQSAPNMSQVGQIMEMADILASGGSLEDAAADSSANAPIELADEELQEAASAAETSADATQGEETRDVFEEELIPDEDVEEIIEEVDDASMLAEEAAEADESLTIFVDEARNHLQVLKGTIGDEGVLVDDPVVRALHTLSGSSGMADLGFIEELARPTYELASILRGTGERRIEGDAADYLTRAIAALDRCVESLASGEPQEDHLQLIAEADHLIVAASEEAEAGQARRDALMALEGLNDVMGADEFLRSWKDGAKDLACGDRLIRALMDMGDVALEHEAGPIAELAHAFAGALTRLADETLGESLFNALCRGHDELLNQFDALAAEQSLDPADDLVAMLDTLGYGGAYADDLEADDLQADDLGTDDVEAEEALDATERMDAVGVEESSEEPDEEADVSENIITFPGDGRDEEIRLDEIDDRLLAETDELEAGSADDVEVAPAPVSVEADPVAEVEIPPAALPAAVAELLPEEVDDEIIEVFFEEAAEILEALEENIHQWSSEPDNRLYLEHMLR